MSIQAKHRRTVHCLVAANAFEDAAAIVQSVHGNMRIGVLPANDLAIAPNPPCLSETHLITWNLGLRISDFGLEIRFRQRSRRAYESAIRNPHSALRNHLHCPEPLIRIG